MEKKSQEFNHKLGARVDQLAILGELEHIRRHALRSAVIVSDNDEEFIHYAVIAKRARDLRREYMAAKFPDISDEDWCLTKAAACLRQLNYEVNSGEELKPFDDLVDEILTHALGEDMSGCKACREDRQITKATLTKPPLMAQ